MRDILKKFHDSLILNMGTTESRSLAVIMSVYKNDRLQFVKEAVKSILDQTYNEFDFFIIFDGPIKKEVRAYLLELNDSRITIIDRKENKGLAYSLNELLQIVLKEGYQYIARMDADDISMEDRFFEQISYLKCHTDVDCVGSWAIEIEADGKEFFRKKMPENHDQCLEMFKKRDCLIHPTVVFQRTYFEKAGLYPEDTYFGEDTMMWANGFASNCKFGNVQRYLLKFRLDEEFFNRRRGWKHAKSILTLRRKVNKLLGFGYKEDSYAFLYATVKMMPKILLNYIYKIIR